MSKPEILNKDIYRIIGENITLFRKKEGMNMEALARKAGISTSFLGNIEKGSRKATLYSIQKIADGLEVGMSTLMTYKVKEKYLPEDSQVTLNIMKLLGTKTLEEKQKIYNILKQF